MKYLIRITRKRSMYADTLDKKERRNLFVAEFKNDSELIERFKMRNVQRVGSYLCSARFENCDILSTEAIPYRGRKEEALFKEYRNVLTASILSLLAFLEEA